MNNTSFPKLFEIGRKTKDNNWFDTQKRLRGECTRRGIPGWISTADPFRFYIGENSQDGNLKVCVLLTQPGWHVGNTIAPHASCHQRAGGFPLCPVRFETIKTYYIPDHTYPAFTGKERMWLHTIADEQCSILNACLYGTHMIRLIYFHHKINIQNS